MLVFSQRASAICTGDWSNKVDTNVFKRVYRLKGQLRTFGYAFEYFFALRIISKMGLGNIVVMNGSLVRTPTGMAKLACLYYCPQQPHDIRLRPLETHWGFHDIDEVVFDNSYIWFSLIIRYVYYIAMIAIGVTIFQKRLAHGRFGLGTCT